ncbi:MAG TPA: sugar ABC transporter substrate-binding protein [Longimicrobiales bacterium]|nr:sugar ABC transporter substrate-binding protein [Longimicrobiales bacterium]
MRPRVAALVPLAAALLSTACGDRDDAPIELRFWGMGREGEVVGELVREFERENPDIRVRVQQIPWTAAHEKLLTALVGDATPDVAQLGNTWVPEFVALNALQPLEAWVARPGGVEPDRFFPGIWDTNVIDSVAYGIPWYVDTRVLFYRTDLLAEAGYARPPDTWEGWRAAMERLRRRMGPGQYPILLPINEWAQPVILGMQAGSPLLREDGGRGDFRGARFRRGFEFYVGLFRDSLAPALSNTDIANLYQEFARGNIAMYISGPWNIGEFLRRIPEELQHAWSTAPLPGPGGPGLSIAGGSSLVVFRGTEHAEAAWRLVEFLSRVEQQAAFYELTGNLPAVRAAWDDPALAGNEYAAAFRDQLERVAPLPKVPEWENIATKVLEYSEAAIRGGGGIERALADLDRDVDRILDKRRWMQEREQRP